MIVLKMRIKVPKNLMSKHLITMFFAGVCVCMFTSCEGPITSREYEEIVIVPDSDPHDFMRSTPFAGSQQLNLSPSMQFPAGADNQQMQDMLDASVAKSSLSWETPRGWSQEKGSGMRLVTFRTQNGAVECSIVSLGGQAGGLRSNVIRWMGQMNINVPIDDQFSEYLSRQKTLKTKGGFSMTIIDLSEFSQEGNSPSMIAAIAELEDKTIFVKMTGSRNNIVSNRDRFISLIQSLTL